MGLLYNCIHLTDDSPRTGLYTNMVFPYTKKINLIFTLCMLPESPLLENAIRTKISYAGHEKYDIEFFPFSSLNHAWIQRGGGGGDTGSPDHPPPLPKTHTPENHKLYGFLKGISNWTPPGKSWTPPPPPGKCWTPSGTLENYSFL